MNTNYSIICQHNRLQRIDKDFVRCLECGQSMISQSEIKCNKSRRDFTKENKNFLNNFDRNFSNVLEETDEMTNVPLFEYYADKSLMNKIIINRQVKFNSQPSKYQVQVNDTMSYLTEVDIRKLLSDINAIRIDPTLAKDKFKNNLRKN